MFHSALEPSVDAAFESFLSILEDLVVRYVGGQPVTVPLADGQLVVMQKGQPDRPLARV